MICSLFGWSSTSLVTLETDWSQGLSLFWQGLGMLSGEFGEPDPTLFCGQWGSILYYHLGYMEHYYSFRMSLKYSENCLNSPILAKSNNDVTKTRSWLAGGDPGTKAGSTPASRRNKKLSHSLRIILQPYPLSDDSTDNLINSQADEIAQRKALLLTVRPCTLLQE